MRSPEGSAGSQRSGTEREATYDIDAELRFSHTDFVVSSAAAAVGNLTFRLDIPSWSGHDADQLLVSVSGEAFDGLDAALAADDTVAQHQLIAEFETERLYRVEVAACAKQLVPLFESLGAVVRDARCTREGWVVRAHLSTRSVLTELTERCGEECVAMEVTRLSLMGDVDDPEGAVLSSEQRELLATAIDYGYFETPRGISQNDLARMFDVSPSAISQRLRTATGELVAHNLGVQ